MKTTLRKLMLFAVTAILIASNSCGDKEILLADDEIIDIDGNIYRTVTIGSQTWMAENLKVITLNDGTDIPKVEAKEDWTSLTSPGYCWFNNDKEFAETRNIGVLYNWYTVNTNNLCPDGWHVPEQSEWSQLNSFLADEGYDGNQGYVLKSTYDWAVNGNGIDRYDFTGLPGSKRHASGNWFEFYEGKGQTADFWSSTPIDNGAYNAMLFPTAPILFHKNYYDYECGKSIRCVKD